MGIGNATGHINKRSIIVERDTETGPDRGHEIHLCVILDSVGIISLVVKATNFGGQAREVRLNAEDKVVPLIIESNLAATGKRDLVVSYAGTVKIIAYVSGSEVKLGRPRINTDIKSGPSAFWRRCHWHHVFFRRNGTCIR